MLVRLKEISPWSASHHEVLKVEPQVREGAACYPIFCIPGLGDLGVRITELTDERGYPYTIHDNG